MFEKNCCFSNVFFFFTVFYFPFLLECSFAALFNYIAYKNVQLGKVSKITKTT